MACYMDICHFYLKGRTIFGNARCEDTIEGSYTKMSYHFVEWIRLRRDGDRYRSLVNTVLKLFYIIFTTIRF
jgi:hypothetical protein